MKTRTLPIVEIETTAGTKLRHVQPATVEEYAEAKQAGAVFPPLIVFAEKGSERYILADGFHRLEAEKKNGRKETACEVREGGRREALAYALGANDEHGLRRTKKDKQRAVDTALKDQEWGTWNNVEVSRLCRVDEKTVRNRRRELALSGEIEKQDTVKTNRGGKVVEQRASAPRSRKQESTTYTRSDNPTSSIEPRKSGTSKKREAKNPKLTPEQKRVSKQVRESHESKPKLCPRCNGTGYV